MNFTRVFGLFLIAALLPFLSCGGGNDPTTGPPSKLKQRAFITNSFAGRLDVMNAATDIFSSAIGINAGATFEVLTPDKTKTLVFESGSNTVEVIDNATESVVSTVAFPAFTESIVVTPDNKTALIAVRNAPVTLQPTGIVYFLDLTNYNVPNAVNIPGARWLYLNKAGTKALVFTDGSNNVAVLDVAARTSTTLSPGFDRPIWAAFSSDDSKAYVVSCGPECGGTTAKVTAFDMASNTAGVSVNVSAGTVGYLDSANLYVAGSAGAAGKLDVVNTSNMTVTKSGVAITDGFHNKVLFTNGKLWIGARTCSNQNCLSIFDPSAQTAITVPCAASGPTFCPNGDVTGMDAIPGRNIVYAIEGSELVIYDSSALKPLPSSSQTFLTGQVFDVKYVDQ